MPLGDRDCIRVCVIEDNPGDRDLVRSYLEGTTLDAFELRVAGTMMEGKAVAEEFKPDAIILDLNLPDSQPADTVESIVKLSEYGAVLVVSGSWDQRLENVALRNGAVEFIEKDMMNARRLQRSLSLGLQRFEQSQKLSVTEKAFERSREGLIICDENGDRPIMKANRAMTSITGYSREELLGRNPRILQAPGIDPEKKAEMRNHLQNGEPGAWKLKNKKKNGQVFWNYMSFAPVRTNGELSHWVSAIRDITEERERRKELENQNETLKRYQLVIENATDLITIKSTSGEYLLINRAARNKSPLYSELADHQEDRIFFEEEPAPQLWSALDQIERRDREVIESQRVEETEETIPTTEGEATYLTTRVPFELEEGKEGIINISKDITELKHKERQLQETNDRLMQVAENIEEAFYLTSPDLEEYFYANKAAGRLYGIDLSELKEDPFCWLKHVRDEYVAKFEQDILSGPGRIEEFKMQEFELDHPSRGHRWLVAKVYPISDETGQVYRLVTVTQDITERREAEVRLRRSEKMSALGQMAGGVAHDFNNFISVILGYADLIKDEIESEEVLEDLTELREAGESAQRLVEDLLNFARSGEGKVKSIDAMELIEQRMGLLDQAVGEDVALELGDRCDADRRVMADPSKMSQVWLNLAVNAADAMPEGGQLTVDVARGERKEGKGSFQADYVRYSFSDTGGGIPEDIQKKIFEPLFSTKGDDGTGLGLATCQGIVRDLGGDIVLRESTEAGTTFDVYLPIAT